MEYTVKQLSDLAGVSTRTLRYYDSIGLLKPSRLTETGYRIYGSEEVDRLQQLLFFREFDIPLKVIKELLDSETTTSLDLLEQHHEALLEKRQHIDSLILNVEKTIASTKGELSMTDREKFQAFKAHEINKNEEQYGQEIREKYGDDLVERSNQIFLSLTNEEYQDREIIEEKIFQLLSEDIVLEIPSENAKTLYELHKRWMELSAGKEILSAYRGIVEMYLEDGRFTAYYDEKAGKGATQILHDSILYYLDEN